MELKSSDYDRHFLCIGRCVRDISTNVYLSHSIAQKSTKANSYSKNLNAVGTSPVIALLARSEMKI